jgi:TetR/AcrR family transcriptional regulator, transcriptional repressor for nem operon
MAMTGPEKSPAPSRLTARGAATRARIVEAAADLMRVQGVNGTTLDDVIASSGVSKSQLYRHFPDKESLVRAVVALQGHRVLEREQNQLGRLNTFSGLQRWRNVLVQLNGLHDGAYGCMLGSMANEVADQDEQARAALQEMFAAWKDLIATGLRRMQDKGSLKPGADPDLLATGLMAALQGGYLLAQTAHDTKPMAIALDMALDQIKANMAEDSSPVEPVA